MAEFFARLVPKKSTQPGEVPNPDLDLIEGEIAVNTADGKIWTKHSDGTLVPLGGGGGGDGGSVGDVFRRTAQFWGNSKKTTDTPAEVVGPGAWCIRTDLQGITVSEFSADGTRFDGNAYSSGSTITLTVNGVDQVFTLAADPTQVVDQLFTFEFTEDTTSLNNLLNGTDLVAIDLVTTDAEDGDILVWSDACQCWLAEAPPTIPDVPVQSVNGQTGDVTLDVLDLDDVEQVVSQSATGEFSDEVGSGNWGTFMDAHSNPPGFEFPTAQGQWRAYFTPANLGDPEGDVSCQIASLSTDGVTCDGWASFDTNGLKVAITVDGVTHGPLDVLTITDSGTFGIFFKWSSEQFDPATDTDWGYSVGDPEKAPDDVPLNAKIEFGYTWVPSGSDELVPLAEGDVLTYHASSQTWRPQPPSGIERIQDASDFDLTQKTVATYSWDYQGVVGSSSPTAGNCQKLINYYTGRAIYFSTTDKFGHNIHDKTLSMTSADVITASINGVEVWSGSGNTWNDTANSETRFQILFANPNDVTGAIAADDVLTLEVAAWNVPEDIPLAEGDHLEWDATDEAFKPTQLATVAKTGSYNDLTDQPTLPPENAISKIQDAEDYKLRTGTNDGALTLTKSVDQTGDGQFYAIANNNSFVGDYFTIYKYGNDVAEFQKLSDGDELQFVFDGTHLHTNVFEKVAPNGSNDSYVTCKNDFPPEGISCTSFVVSSPKFSTGDVFEYPINDGDLLQWSQAEQAFQPGPLSYNDLTDQPTLPPENAISKIQDADDFKLQQQASPDAAEWIVIAKADASGGMPNGSAYGEWSGTSSNVDRLVLSPIDLTGIDRRTAGELWTWIQAANKTWQQLTINGVNYSFFFQYVFDNSTDSGANRPAYVIEASPGQAAIDAGLKFQEIGIGSTISWKAFNDEYASGGGFVDVPLAHDDILRWNNGTQAFMPAQLDIIERIQDASDFKLVQIPPEETAEGRWICRGSHGDPGSMFGPWYSSGNDRYYVNFNSEDADGNTWLPDAGDEIWMSVDGVLLPGSYVLETKTAVDSGAYYQFRFLSPTISWPVTSTGSEVRLWTSAPVAEDRPLIEGDHLQWSDANQAFMPVQLDPVFSGDYNDLANTPDLSLKADLVGGKVPADQLPAIAISEFLGTVADEAAMLALTGQSGDWCVRVDTDSAWILSADDASVLANWIELGSGGAGGVVSVNDKVGAVSLGIQDMNDFKPQPLDAFPHDFRWSPKVADGAPATGEWGTSQLRFSPTDADGTAFNTTGSTQMWLSPDASVWEEVTAEIQYYSADDYYYVATADIPDLHQQIEDEAWASLYLHFTDPGTVDLGAAPPVEADVLQWSDANQAFMPVQLDPTFSGDYNDLTNAPELAAVATSGSYNDLTDTPNLDVTVYSFPTAIGKDEGVAGMTGSWSYTDGALRLSHLTASGNIRDGAAAINPAGDVDFWISEDGNAWHFVGGGTGYGIRFDDPDWVFTNYAAWNTIQIDPANNTGGYLISFSDPRQGAQVLNDLNDVETGGYNYTTTFDLSDGSPKRFQGGNAASLHTDELGTWAYKVPAAANLNYGDEAFIKDAQLTKTKRFTVVNLKVRQSAAFDTTNRMSLGGTKPTLTSGAGWTIYTRDTGFGWYGTAYTEVGTKPAMAADTWYEITYALDWGPGGLRDSLPALSLWVDGALCVDNVQETHGYSELTDGTEYNFYLASNGTSSTDKYWSDITVTETQELPWGMSDATITDPATQLHALSESMDPGEALVWDGAMWRPGSAARLDGYVGMQLADLTDVQIAPQGANLRKLIVDQMATIEFVNNSVATGMRHAIYSNSAYGFTIGSYVPSPSTDTDYGKARRTYYDDAGILHNCGDQPLWIMGKLGNNYTTETPEVRWTSGNPGDSATANDGHYVGLKLPAGITEDTTYTFPLTDGEAQQVLATDGAGQLTWQTDTGLTRIQDASDFALNVTQPPPQENLSRINTGAGDTSGDNGELFPFSSDVYICQDDADGIDQSANLPALNSGAGNISILIDGTVYTSAYTDVITWPNGNSPNWVRLLGARTGDLLTALDNSVGQTVGVVSPDFAQTEIPLAQGDVISWDAGQGAFTPQQLNLPASYVTSLDDLDDVDTTTTAPTDKQVLAWDESQLRWMPRTDPAAPVQSVQDKIGDVRLTVQEMDDYDLRKYTPPMQRWDEFVSFNCNATPTYPGLGQFSGPTTCYGNGVLRFGPLDADGNEFGPDAWPSQMEAGETVYVLTDLAADWVPYELDDKPTWSASRGWNLDFLSGTLDFAAVGTGFTWIQVSPAPGAAYVDIPMEVGDILVWDDDPAHGRAFRPKELSYNDLADAPAIPSTFVESINNLDGVVTFGMNDLNDVVSDYTPDNRAEWTQLASGTPTNRAPKSPGQWGYFEGGENNRQLRLNYVDGVGAGWGDVMQNMPDSGTLYVSQDDVTFLALPYRAKSHNTTDGYWSFFVDPYVPPKVDGSLFVSLQPPESPNFQPFAQGSHLEFTGALWQPVQLATVAKSGSYNDLDDAPVVHTAGRATETLSFPQLGPGQTGEGSLVETGRGGTFLTVHADEPCWIRLYTDPGSRSADVARSQTVNPDRGSGVLLEVIADGSITYKITPAVGYFNLEEPTQGRLAVAVTNTDGGATLDINVTVSVLVVEP